MGVKGLATFVKDNQNSICRTVSLEQARDGADGERVPIIVDAWGVIFQLWLSSLPWTSGGEYLRYYRLVHRLIASWRSVGLEPVFMFDGSAPSSKIETILSRLDDQLRTARLFYTTSPASRSAPSFSRSCGKILLPPLASQTFIHALHDAGVEAHFAPVGEADGACVALAEERGGYVFGLDSDYYVLVAGAGLRRVKGYCPTDMMAWVEGEEQDTRNESGYGQDGGAQGLGEGEGEWSQPRSRGAYNNRYNGNGSSSTAGPSQGSSSNNNGWFTSGPRQRPAQRERTSPLLPPSDLRNPKLLLRVITPTALRARLRLPPQMMPLFGALIGNDHTPYMASEHFFEPGLSGSQKVDKVARVIREVVYAPPPRNAPSAGGIALASASASTSVSGVSTPNGSDAGDHAYQLVKRIMARLAWKLFVTESIQTEVMEAIIEATVQYALPSLQRCCGEYPFCGEFAREGGCENAARAWAEDTFDDEASHGGAGEGAETEQKHVKGRQAYAAAQKRGLLNHATHVYLYPNRILMWATMEDPSGPSLKAEEGARGIRTAAYLYVEEALGGLTWENEEDKKEEEYTNGLARDHEGEAGKGEGQGSGMTPEEEDRAARKLLGVETPTQGGVDRDGDGDTSMSVASDTTAVGAGELQKAISEVTGEVDMTSTDLDRPPRRHMVEFARHTNRHMPFRIDLPSAPPFSSSSYSTCMALAPLPDRLHAFLAPLHSATPLILALPPCLQPLAAYVRFCVVEAALRAERAGRGHHAADNKWKGKEVEAVLKAGVGSFACWAREKVAVDKENRARVSVRGVDNVNGVASKKEEEALAWPELTTRNSHILSQLASVMTDALYLAQALLLLPDTQLPEGMPGSPIGTKRKVSGSSASGSGAVKSPKVAQDAEYAEARENASNGEAGPNSISIGIDTGNDNDNDNVDVNVNVHGEAGDGTSSTTTQAIITPPTATPAINKTQEARMPTLTHLTPFVFFSGVSLHMLLSDQVPPGWQWSERDERLLQMLLAAVQEGLPGGTVKGWSGVPITSRDATVVVQGVEVTIDGPSGNAGADKGNAEAGGNDGVIARSATAESDYGAETATKARKGKKKKHASNGSPSGKTDSGANGAGARGGRFDILASAME